MTASKTRIVQLPECRISEFRCPGADSAILLRFSPLPAACPQSPQAQGSARARTSERSTVHKRRICERLEIKAKKEILVLLLRGTDVMGQDRAVCVKGTGVTSSWSWTKHMAHTERKSP